MRYVLREREFSECLLVGREVDKFWLKFERRYDKVGNVWLIGLIKGFLKVFWFLWI